MNDRRMPGPGEGRPRRLWLTGWPALAALAIGLAGWRRRALTADGAAAATVVGTVVLARGGLPAAGALVAFFVTSSALSRFKAREKARRGVLAQAKGGQRDAWQVLANGGLAAACIGLAGRHGTGPFLGALAAASADTWATELGLLAPNPPRRLTTLRPVPPGTSGAVTTQGTLAGLAGATTVGLTWSTVRWLESLRRPLGPHDAASAEPGAARVVLSTAIAGSLGSLADSLVGATAQAAYWCYDCGEPAETPVHARCGQPTQRVRGLAWMSNDLVNALATIVGALLGAAMLARRPERATD